MDLSKLFAGISSSVGNVVHGLENDFSSGVQNFQQQANKLLAPQQQQNQPNPQIGGQSVPLFIKPQQPNQQQGQQQGQQQNNFLGGPLSTNAPEPQTPPNPLLPTNPGTPAPQPQQQQPVQPPMSGQDMLNQALNMLEGSARNLVNGAGNFIQQQGQDFMQGKNMIGQPMPYNPVNNPFGYGTPHVDFTSGINTGNGFADFGLKTLAGIPESIINAPHDEQAAQKQAIQDIGSGQILQPNVAASDVAQVGLPIATIATLPEGGSALASLGKQGLKEAVLQGGLQGAKYGAGFGAAGAIAGNRNVTDPNQYAANVAMGTGEGLGAGAILGGGMAGAGSGVRNLFSTRGIDATDFSRYGQAFSTPEGQKAVLDKIQQAATDQPQFHSILESGALDTSGRAISNIKSPTSIIGKYIEHQKDGEQNYNINDMGDILRGSVVMPDKKLMPQALQTVKDELASRGWSVDQEEDFFKNPGDNNYKGYHLNATSTNGTKAEIQFHDQDSYANARLTHDQYSQFGDQMPDTAKKQIGQLQARIKSDPTAQVEAATKQKELQDLPNALSPMQTDFSGSSAKSPRVMQLQAQRDQLQATRRDPDEFPDQIKQLQDQRDQIKSQLQASKTPKGVDKNTRIALRNQADNLTQQHQALDTQVKSLQRQHRLNVKDQNARIDQQTDAIDTQLKDEQGKTAARTFVAQRLRAQQDSFQKKSPLAGAKVLSDKEKKDAGMPTLRKATLPAGSPDSGNVVLNALGPSIFGRLKGAANAGVRRIAYGIQDAKSWGDFQGQSRAYRLQQLRQDMTPQEKNNAVDVMENKAQPMSDRVLQWANAADQERDAVFGAAKQTGLKTKYLKDYFPHTYDKDTQEQIANDHEYQKAVMKAGKANNEEEAANYLRRTGGRISPQELGSLHEHRLDKTNKYPWVKDPAVMETYLQNAYKEIGYTSAFKPGMTEVTSVLKNQRSNPGMTNVLKQVLADAGVTYAPELSPEAQAVKDSTKVLRNADTLTSLTPGLTPLSHLPALGHAATRLSPGDVMKALPTGVKAFFGKFSDEQKQNIARLAVDNSSELYGGGSKMSAFYKAIGLNKTLNVLSAVVHDASQSRMNWLEQNLQTPEAQRDIMKAGLPYQDIVARGSFSPADRYQYVNEALKDSSLELSGLDMPGAAQGSIGKALFQFSGPEQQALRRFLPAAGKELLHGNVGRKLAVGTGLAASAGLGMAAVDAKNVLANKPAQTPQDIAMEGTALGLGIPGSSNLVNAVEYPEFNMQTGVQAIDQIPGVDTALTTVGNTALGPIGGKLQSFKQIGQGIPIGQKPSAAAENTAIRTAIKSFVPFFGQQIANTAFPANSYVGNRPTDVASALMSGKPIQHGTGNFAYNTNPTLADIFRQNPTVQQKNDTLTQISQTKQQIMGQYNSSDQAMYNNLNAQLQSPYNGTGNALNVKAAYGEFANNPGVLEMKTRIEVANAKFNGTQVNPLWELGLTDPKEQKAILQYKAASPADQQAWKKVPANAQMYNDYQAQTAKYYAQNPSEAQSLQSAGISAPAPSAHVSQVLAQYDASKAGGAKPNYALLDNDPEVQQYFAGLDQFNNYVSGLMGLPQTAGQTGSGSGGYGSSSSSSNYLEKELMYQAMSEARSKISVPKVSLAPSKSLVAVQNQKLPSMNLSLGPKGQSIYQTAPKLSIGTAPKLTHFTLAKGVGKLKVGNGPKIPSQGGGSPGRTQQIKLT